jgi:flavin reductase (DIM6/NTAB) family NADH-FMN oxidoreductase RutF
MFYEPGKTDHNLPYDPFKACVIPRPIGWISTVSPTISPDQKPIYNLAPFSQFNNLTFDPPYIMFSSNQTGPVRQSQQDTTQHPSLPSNFPHPGFHRKDTVHNAESTGYFCWQLATYALREAVNASAESLPYTVDEFKKANLKKTWSRILPVKIPMVAESPVRFECQYFQTIRLPGNPPFGTVDVVIGRVLGVHIEEGCLTEGKIDVKKTMPIARCGYVSFPPLILRYLRRSHRVMEIQFNFKGLQLV